MEAGRDRCANLGNKRRSNTSLTVVLRYRYRDGVGDS
jgi:hypothetical protein